MTFFENPLVEGKLSFCFGNSPGATRYETWTSHVHGFQQLKKKAVDFIFASEKPSKLFFTEIKDFQTLTREGKYQRGNYSLCLAADTAQKFTDSLEGYHCVQQNSQDKDERAFVENTQNYPKTLVFHWEFHPDFPRQKQLHDMKTMKTKLRELLDGVCSHIQIESIDINPSHIWKVTRINTKLK